MKLADTRDKLEEAQVFLRLLDKAQHDKPASIPFRYCLSAFLNAAYGVQEYLRAEFIRTLREQACTQGKKLSRREPRILHTQRLEQWTSSLPQEKRALWDSMIENRDRETHENRVKTVTEPKAVSIKPAPRYPYGTEHSVAFAAQYMMLQQVAAYYPEMAETLAKERLPLGTGAWREITERHLKIGKALHSTAKACGDYVALLDGLISHFEQSAP